MAMALPTLLDAPGGIWLTLGFFALANFLYQSSMVFYNSLLPVVSKPANAGRVSGLGVGLGYLGIPLALVAAQLVSRSFGMAVTFPLAGALVILISIPLFLWVPERRVEKPERLSARMVGEEYRRLLIRLRALPAMPNLLKFLLANFLCVDVLNTAIFWTSVYLKEGLGFDEADIIGTLIGANLAAFAIGCGLGWVTDRLGSKPTMMIAAAGLLTALPLLAWARDPWTVRLVLWSLGAMGLSGIWVSGRKLLLDLVPKERVGEFFGFYGLTVKGAAFGVVFFGILGDWVGIRGALLFATIPLIIGLALLAWVDPRGGLTGGSSR
jgi:UMF1 family MFS transporter